MVWHLLSLALGSALGLSATQVQPAGFWIHIPEIVEQRSRGQWSPQTPLNGSQSRHLEIKREEGNLSGVGDTIRKKTQANGNLDICLRIKERLSFSPLAAVCPINLSSLTRVF